MTREALRSTAAAATVLLSVIALGCGAQPGIEVDQIVGEDTPVNEAGTGGMTVSVEWPEAHAALIPSACASIKIVVKDKVSGRLLVQKLLTRDAPSATITGLRAGSTVTDTVTAHPTLYGTGAAMASGTVDVVIPDGSNAPVAITLSSTIATVTLSPAALDLAVGKTKTFVATAKNATNATILVQGTWLWQSSDTNVATVDAAGLVTSVGAGTAAITATESESGVSGTATVRAPQLTVSPASLTFGINNATATLTIGNAGPGAITWSTSSTATFLTRMPTSGTGGGTVQLTVAPTTFNKVHGDYSGIVKVTSVFGVVEVPCTVTVPNHAPTISYLTATPASTLPGRAVALKCTAADLDRDVLSYEWTVSDGYTANTTGTTALVSLTAPPTGVYTVTCTVTDGQGGTASRSVVVTVN